MLTFPRTPTLCHPFLFIHVSLASITLLERGIYRESKTYRSESKTNRSESRTCQCEERILLPVWVANTLENANNNHSWVRSEQYFLCVPTLPVWEPYTTCLCPGFWCFRYFFYLFSTSFLCSSRSSCSLYTLSTIPLIISHPTFAVRSQRARIAFSYGIYVIWLWS